MPDVYNLRSSIKIIIHKSSKQKERWISLDEYLWYLTWKILPAQEYKIFVSLYLKHNRRKEKVILCNKP
jgi:hypothetical protein